MPSLLLLSAHVCWHLCLSWGLFLLFPQLQSYPALLCLPCLSSSFCLFHKHWSEIHVTKITHLKVSFPVSFSTCIDLYTPTSIECCKISITTREAPYSLSRCFPHFSRSQSPATSLWICLFWIFHVNGITYSVTFQFSSVQPLRRVRLFATPMDHSTPGLPVHHQLPEFTQTHVHWVGDAVQPSHPLSSLSPPAFNLSQHNIFRSHLCCSMDQYIIPSYSWVQCPLYAYTTVCLSVHPLVDIWAVFIFWLLWIVLLWTCVYMYLSLFPLFWDIPRNGIAGSHTNSVFNFWRCGGTVLVFLYSHEIFTRHHARTLVVGSAALWHVGP